MAVAVAVLVQLVLLVGVGWVGRVWVQEGLEQGQGLGQGQGQELL